MVNVQHVYTGPSEINKVNCYNSYTTVDQVKKILNGSQEFYLYFTPSTNDCPETFRNVTSNTPGFVVVSTNPELPFTIPKQSTFELQVEIRTPSVNFYGPLTITIGSS